MEAPLQGIFATSDKNGDGGLDEVRGQCDSGAQLRQACGAQGATPVLHIVHRSAQGAAQYYRAALTAAAAARPPFTTLPGLPPMRSQRWHG